MRHYNVATGCASVSTIPAAICNFRCRPYEVNGSDEFHLPSRNVQRQRQLLRHTDTLCAVIGVQRESSHVRRDWHTKYQLSIILKLQVIAALQRKNGRRHHIKSHANRMRFYCSQVTPQNNASQILVQRSLSARSRKHFAQTMRKHFRAVMPEPSITCYQGMRVSHSSTGQVFCDPAFPSCLLAYHIPKSFLTCSIRECDWEERYDGIGG